LPLLIPTAQPFAKGTIRLTYHHTTSPSPNGDRPAHESIDEIEITPEMILAAQDAYWDLDERSHSSDEKFEAAIRAPLEHSAHAERTHSQSHSKDARAPSITFAWFLDLFQHALSTDAEGTFSSYVRHRMF
jgi:hypothetical protein